MDRARLVGVSSIVAPHFRSSTRALSLNGEHAMDELNALILRRGVWGEIITRKQKMIGPQAEVEVN